MATDTNPAAALSCITTVQALNCDAGSFSHLRAGHIDFITCYSRANGTYTYKVVNTATGQKFTVDYREGRTALESAARNVAHQVNLARVAYAAEVAAA